MCSRSVGANRNKNAELCGKNHGGTQGGKQGRVVGKEAVLTEEAEG